MNDFNTSHTLQRIITETRATKSGDRHKGHCPVCPPEKSPSLSIALVEDGKVLLFCHRCGSTVEELANALDVTLGELMADDLPPPPSPRSTVTDYVYTDEDGKVLYRKQRTRSPSGKKSFVQLRPVVESPDVNVEKDWAFGLGDVRRVLYHLPAVIEAVKTGEPIYIVEGEKDADRMNGDPDLGDYIVATTPGSSKDWRPHAKDFTESLSGASHVIVIQDDDKPGREQARRIADDLEDHVGLVEIVKAKTGNDVSDHLDAGFTLAELVSVDGGLEVNVMSFSDLIEMGVPQIPWVIEPWLATGDRVIFAGESKTGKSTLALRLALSLASGTDFLGTPIRGGPRRVMYVDEEPNLITSQKNLEILSKGMGLTLEDLKRQQVAYTHHEGFVLDREEPFRRLRKTVRRFRPDFVIFDSLSRIHDMDENSNSDMKRFFRDYLDAVVTYTDGTRAGYVVIHHMSKTHITREGKSGGGVRGASRIKEHVDATWTYTKAKGRGRPGVRKPSILEIVETRWPGVELVSIKVEVHVDALANSDPSVMRLEGAEASMVDKVLARIQKAGATGITQAEIVAEMGHGLERTGKAIKRAVKHLEAEGTVKSSPEKQAGGGRDTKRLWDAETMVQDSFLVEA